MYYRIEGLRLSPEEKKEIIPEKIKKRLRLRGEIGGWRIVRESLDARDKREIKYVYTVDFETEEERPDLKQVESKTYVLPFPGEKALHTRPVVAGFGPCGIFAALILAECGYRPIVVERGKPVEERAADVARFWQDGVLDENSNVQFGEGGAGTFSDGKLTTGIKDSRIPKVLSELAAAGGGEAILYKQKPHIGTDVLRGVVVGLREKIIAAGGEIRFGTRLEGYEVDRNGRLAALVLKDIAMDREERITAEALVLAIGHSARDTYRALHRAGITMEPKPFSIGVRIEHPQHLIDIAQYGKRYAGMLPPAEYKLSCRCGNGRGVYTFCMCPGGEVIAASSQKGGVVTNGMSNSRRDGAYANSGMLVDVRIEDFGTEDPLGGIAFQEKYERLAYQNGGGGHRPPQTRWVDFAEGNEAARPVTASIPAFATEAIREAMPHFACKIKGFDDPEARLFAVESRSSSPVRILRNDRLQCNVTGIYPGGEGAGYAGGIVSSAVDGIRLAEEIVKNFNNNEMI